jgi:hypothetical protein
MGYERHATVKQNVGERSVQLGLFSNDDFRQYRAANFRQERSPSPIPCGVVRESFIVSRMSRSIGGGVWAWLLCALLLWLTVNPPYCDLCDGFSVNIASAHQPGLKHSHPIAPDSCNGICTCCGFYGLPTGEPVFVPVSAVLANVVPESIRAALTSRSTVFRPPRLVTS